LGRGCRGEHARCADADACTEQDDRDRTDGHPGDTEGSGPAGHESQRGQLGGPDPHSLERLDHRYGAQALLAGRSVECDVARRLPLGAVGKPGIEEAVEVHHVMARSAMARIRLVIGPS
jgi:hypothetical protein